ncbi:hypothetical protein PIB30_099423, partial [Stylosanthes scabra]|nr:hypothetical protein [Stylosanthes scabra]
MDGNPAFKSGQGWEPCQVGYYSDGSSDGYFSYEDSLSACQINNVEFRHQVQFEATFETLVQERAEIMEAQKRTEEEGLSAITLRSGTWLKGPTGESLDFAPITPEGTDTQRDVKRKEEFPTTEQEATSSQNKRVVDPNLNPLLFPA